LLTLSEKKLREFEKNWTRLNEFSRILCYTGLRFTAVFVHRRRRGWRIARRRAKHNQKSCRERGGGVDGSKKAFHQPTRKDEMLGIKFGNAA
jgi:hypothetical protein